MQHLKFQNPIYCPGLQTTVRLGTKWQERVSPGDRIQLVNAKDHVIATATVEFLYVGPLVSIPQYMIEMEHDPACRTVGGLLSVMNRPEVYGGSAAGGSCVTVIGYWV
jgi:hypothetical protein